MTAAVSSGPCRVPVASMAVSALLLAGIVAKGLGIIAGIFAAGVLVGVVITVMITSRIARMRRR